MPRRRGSVLDRYRHSRDSFFFSLVFTTCSGRFSCLLGFYMCKICIFASYSYVSLLDLAGIVLFDFLILLG